MDMGVIGSGDQWFSSRVRTGGIYRLIDAALKEGSREARIEAIVHLGESRDPRAVYPLIECCGDSDPSIRRFAIEALGKIGSGRAVDVLVGHLDDTNEDPDIRIGAVAALASIRSEHACQELRSRCADPGLDPEIRSAIAKVMEKGQER
jgi:HEAT repeat protein